MEERIKEEVSTPRNLQRVQMEFMFEEINEKIAASGRRATIDPNLVLDVLVGSITNRINLGYRYSKEHLDEFMRLKLKFDHATSRNSPFYMVGGTFKSIL